MKSKNLILVMAGIICILVLAQGVQAAETYHYVTQWGTYGTENGNFTNPHGIAVDSSRNVYVTEPGIARIQKFNSGHVFVTKWGYINDPLSPYYFMQAPTGVAVDSSGNVYDGESSDTARIMIFTSDGSFIDDWITPGGTPGTRPNGVAVGSSGYVYAVSYSDSTILKYNPVGFLFWQYGTYGTGDREFHSPQGIAVDSAENVYIADTGNNRIQKFNSDGTYSTQWGSAGTGNGQFSSPQGIAVDSSGNVYVVDSGNNRIQKFTSAGTYMTQWGSAGTGNGQFHSPQGIAVDSSGNVYVVDSGNNRIQTFYPFLTVTSITPNSGVNTSSALNVEIGGTNFISPFVYPGNVDVSNGEFSYIPVTDVNVVNPNLITCTLDLSGKLPGTTWDVHVTNPDYQYADLNNAFTVTASPPPSACGSVILDSAPLILPGTWLMDLETGTLSDEVDSPQTDIWWEQIDSTHRQMNVTYPIPGATIVNLGIVDFDAITAEQLAQYKYSTTPISGSDLSNQLVIGDVFAVHTNLGNYAKVKVLGRGPSPGYNLTLHVVVYSSFQTCQEEALQVVADELFGGSLPDEGDGISVSVSTVPLPPSSTINMWGDPAVDPLNRITVTTPDAKGYIVFIDDNPDANWEHPCRYVFVYEDKTHDPTYEVYDRWSPPTNLELIYVAGDMPSPGELGIPNDPSYWTPSCTQNCDKYYALLISGGVNQSQNHVRYWNDIAYMYNVLIEYGYSTDHIKVLMSDGTNADPITGLDRHIANSGTKYDSSPLDFSNPPNGNDVTGAAIHSVVDSTLDGYTGVGATALPTDATLFIFTTNHGGWDGTGNKDSNNVKLYLWGTGTEGYITDNDFVAKLNALNVKNITMVMEQCNGGGFRDEFMLISPHTSGTYGANQKRVLITAADYNEPSWGNGFSNAWTSGVAGHNRYLAIDPTADISSPKDERVSMAESYSYASNPLNDPYATSTPGLQTGKEHPQFFSTDTIQYFLNACSGSATKTLRVTSPPAGASWAQGTQQLISWEETGVTGNVLVSLYRGTSTKIADIGTYDATKKNIPWTITASTPTNTGYKIRIQSVDTPTLIAWSTSTFTIVAGTADNIGDVKVSSTPSGATIKIDGSDKNANGVAYGTSGTTASPKIITGLVAGYHSIRLELTGYYPREGSVTIIKGFPAPIDWTLAEKPTDSNGVDIDPPPLGGLEITSSPDGAVVWIGPTGTPPEADYGKTPALANLPPGWYDVYVTRDNFQQSRTQTVRVQTPTPGREPVEVFFELTPNPAVSAKVVIVPPSLNIGRKGYFVAFVRLPTGYKAADVMEGSVFCENAYAIKLVRLKSFPQIFAAVFRIEDLVGIKTGNVQMNVGGSIQKSGGGNVLFKGSDTIKVISKKTNTKEAIDDVMTMPDQQIFNRFNPW